MIIVLQHMAEAGYSNRTEPALCERGAVRRAAEQRNDTPFARYAGLFRRAQEQIAQFRIGLHSAVEIPCIDREMLRIMDRVAAENVRRHVFIVILMRLCPCLCPAKARLLRAGKYHADFSMLKVDTASFQLVQYSFGSATVRMFSELLAHGDADERAATPPDSMSPFFTGGMEKRLHSIVTLASPMNGTTAYDMFEDPGFDPAGVKVPRWSKVLAKMMSLGTGPRPDGRDLRDYAGWDMHLDRARELNERMKPLAGVYYFSVPCSATVRKTDGTYQPKRGIEPLFAARSRQIGVYSGATAKGMPVDESWRENDGLVNTLSATAPAGAPSKPLDRENIERGLWNIFPAVDGDHMWLQGGLLHKHDIRPFYLDLLTMISRTARHPSEIE